MRSWRAWIGFAISAVFLYVAFRGQDFGEIRDALGRANLWWVPLAMVMYFIGVWLRAVRWSVLMRPLAPATGRQLLPIVVVGYMANNVLPLRMGEVVRAFLVRRTFGISRTSALATIAIERIMDGLTMLGFMLVATTFVSFTSDLQHLALIAFVLFTGLLIGLFVLTLNGNLVDRLLQLVLGPLPTRVAESVERLTRSFLGGLQVLGNRRDLLSVAGLSVVAWLFEASMYYTIARGFGPVITDSMGIAATLMTTGVANMATLIPSSPGYIGQFEFGVRLVLNGALGISESQALAYAIVVHAALYFPITVLGIVEWSRQHLSMRQFQQDDDALEPQPTVAGKGTAGMSTSAGMEN